MVVYHKTVLEVNMVQNSKNELGQFIPLHYHYNMLQDVERMQRFKNGINEVLRPGDTVLELGGGTGVLSFFAANKAKKVYTVEYNPELVREAKRILRLNPNGEKVEVIHADAMEFVPEEKIDVVVCEMLHVGLLREKQTEVIHAFKKNYAKKHGSHMPFFIPCATQNAFQPVQHDFNFTGYTAPVILFQDPYSLHGRTAELGNPVLYHQLVYGEKFDNFCSYSGNIQIQNSGILNAFRLITKSILSFSEKGTTDWHSQYMLVPLETPLDVRAGMEIEVSFGYEFGADLAAMKPDVKEMT